MRKRIIVLMILLFVFSGITMASSSEKITDSKKSWTITFNENLANTDYSNQVYILNDMNVKVLSSVQVNKNKIIVKPSSNYIEGREYKLIVKSGIKSINGKSLKKTITKSFELESNDEQIVEETIEKAIFPMKYLNITQGINSNYTHQGMLAIDIAGKDTGIEDAYAPFTGVIKRKTAENHGNTVYFESLDKVKFADGTVDYMVVVLVHDNDISDLYAGKKINKGEIFYQEGTSGKAQGNHIHLEVSKGKYEGSGGYINQYGKWMVNNAVDPSKVLFLTEETIVINDYGYNWKTTSDQGGFYGFSNGNNVEIKYKYGRYRYWNSQYNAWFSTYSKSYALAHNGRYEEKVFYSKLPKYKVYDGYQAYGTNVNDLWFFEEKI